MEKKKVINYYLYLLSKRDYTVQELSDKALDKGYASGDIAAAIEHLQEINYVNDRRFVEVALHTYKGVRGYHWIVQKLRRRKVPNPIIEDMLEDEDFSPSKEFEAKVRAKYRVERFDQLEYKEKTKTLNYMARQGFTGVFDIYKQWERADSEK